MISNYNTSARIQKIGKTGGIIRGQTPLSDDQLRAVVPSIFAEGKHESRSERFTFIPTSEVLTGLRQEGFLPFEARQGGSRIEGKAAFTKHLLRLRHVDAVQSANGLWPEIVLVNAHDGTSSYQLMSGLFRLVCSNGLVLADGEMQSVRIGHTGDIRGKVIDGCIEILGRVPEELDNARQWESHTLTTGHQLAFAKAAMALKWDEENEEGEVIPPPFDAQKLLTLRRREDQGQDLWRTLNVVQENLIKGGVRYVQRDEKGRQRSRQTTREVKGVGENVKLNRGLWVLAQELAKLTA